MNRKRTYKRKSDANASAAGVAAVARALKARVYNDEKARAMVNAIGAASSLGSLDAAGAPVPFSSAAFNATKARQLAKYNGIGTYTGRGGFWSDVGGKVMDVFGGGMGDLGKAGRSIGSAADDILGRFAGAAKGNIMGHGMYTGRGAYLPASNSIVDGGGSNAPLFGGNMATIQITHREFLTDIYGPAAGNSFNVQTYNINPALSGTFPFLSQIACNYDEYTFDQLIFSYKSTTTDIGSSTTGQCGTVIQCVNYNASAAPFQDKGLMMEYFGAVSSKVTEPALCGVECDPQQNAGPSILYTRANPVIVGQDLKTYDLGTYQLAVANSPAQYANNPIGELWVDYTVTLRKPKLFTSRGLEIDRDYFLNRTSLTPNDWFGVSGSSNWLVAQQNNIGCLVEPGVQYVYNTATVSSLIPPVQTRSTAGGCSFTIPASFNGNLKVTVNCVGTSAASLAFPDPVLLGNITAISDLYPAAVSLRLNVPNATQSIYILDIYVRQASAISWDGRAATTGSITGGNNIISFGGMAGITITSACVSIDQYQPLGGLTGISKTNDRVVWVNTSGVVTIPV